MIHRTFDPALHNRIANDPVVRATFGVHLTNPAPIMFDELAARPEEFILLTNGTDACALFESFGPSVWQGHSLFAPSHRGRAAIETGKAMMAWMFANTSARMITGATPINLKAARWFNRRIGFTSDGVHRFNGMWGSYDCEWFRMERATGSPAE